MLLDKVKQRREENLHQNRRDAWRRRRSVDATKSDASSTAFATVHASIYDAFARMIGQAETMIAKAAIEAGASMRVAYATAQIGTNGLLTLAEDILFPGPPDVDRFFSTRGSCSPETGMPFRFWQVSP